MAWLKGAALIGVGWAALIGASTIRAHLPASWWFDPGELIVEDVTVGKCPVLHFDRTIHRPFHGEWIVTLQRANNSGLFSVFRVYDGENDYRPDVSLPETITFAWWAWIDDDECDFPPGTYRVATQWTIHPGGGVERYSRVTSNAFRVEMP